MKRIVWRHRLSWLTGVAIVGLATLVVARAIADARRPAAKNVKPPYVTKNLIESSTQQLLAARNFPGLPAKQPAPKPVAMPRIDFGKGRIELPTKQLLATNTVPASAPPAPAFVNPRVEPGKVRWHKDFAAACAAAKKSGKPVLLFQMMGKLDERFC